ncbi:MAG: TetR family transcriptional regulator [Eubacteriales bacterium]|nr:TetR family transcriptional regulator [Eubacteriales bacterium]
MKDENKVSTKERLLLAATKMFALHGFEGATTREITAEAHANLQSIPFHYESKEKLYQATVNRISKLFMKNYEPLFREVEDAKARKLLDKSLAWNYIVETVGHLSEWVLNEQYKYELLLINHDLLYPTKGICQMMEPLAQIYYYFAELLMAATGNDDEFWANNYSYIVISAFFAYSNMPAFLGTVLKEDISESEVIQRAKMQLKRDMLTSVEAIVKKYSKE